HLPMIPVDPGEGGGNPERVEAAHFHSGVAQSAPEARARLVEAAHPVVKHTYTYTFARLAAQSFRELITRAVIVDDVALEVDPSLRTSDRLQPGRIVLLGVAQQANAVAVHERRARGA